MLVAGRLEDGAGVASERSEAVLLTAGTCLGRFEIVAPLAVGGMGEVYRAKDSELGREVAIKILSRPTSVRPDVVVRFRREAKIVAAVAHPNIVSIYDVGMHLGHCFAVLELLDGETLRKRLARSVLRWRNAAATGAAIADGLSAAHNKGIVHLDLKPENVFLTSDGWVKILDFGIARSSLDVQTEMMLAAGPTESNREILNAPTRVDDKGEDFTPDPEDADDRDDVFDTVAAGGERDTVLGTPPYMSPEQVRGQATSPASDIFSLGCVLYEMVTGYRAFARETEDDTKDAILNEDPPDIADWGVSVSSSFERVITRCLEKHPLERFQSASDLAFTLRSLSTSWAFRFPFRFRRHVGRPSSLA
jgi:eukaryotic-like serine/threonine-protein kinase